MEAQVIKNKSHHDKYLAEIESLMGKDPLPESRIGKRLELLVTLVEAYEREHYFIGKPDPIEAIKIRMEDMGLKQKDLVPYIGSQSKVSEVLSGKRSLSIPMIRSLNEGLGIPTDILIRKSSGGNFKEIDLPGDLVREQEQETIFTHRILWKSGEELLKHAKSKLDGAYYFRLASLLMFCLAYEGFVNYLGQSLLPEIWKKEKDNFQGKGLECKIKVIVDKKTQGFTWEKGRSPYQKIKRLEPFRNALCHSKTEINTSKKIVDENGPQGWDSKWDSFFNDVQTVEKYRRAIKKFCQSLLDAVPGNPGDNYLPPAFEEPLASSSGKWQNKPTTISRSRKTVGI